jgi:hypothetical protein
MNDRYLIEAKWRRTLRSSLETLKASTDDGWRYYHVVAYGPVHYLLSNKEGLHEGEEHVIISCHAIKEEEYLKLIENHLVEDYTRED